MRFGLPDATISRICAVFARHPQVERVVLYGSRALGSDRHGSDIDLTLCGGSELTLRVLFRIMDELDDLLLPYTFDLAILSAITDPEVLEHLQRAGVTFFESSTPASEPAILFRA